MINFIVDIENFKEFKTGVKAHNLFEMRKKGINVPSLFCIDSTMLEQYLKSNYVEIKEKIKAIDFADEKSLEYGSLHLKSIVENIEVEDEFKEKILKYIEQKFKEEKAFGVQIDSLADMINFVGAPIVIALCLGLNMWYHLVIYSLYVLAGITRLGYFNIQVGDKFDVPIKYYSGLPVTYAALIFPVVWITSFWLPPSVFQAVYALTVLIVGLLFIANIKIKKPRGWAYLFFICLAVALVSFILTRGV